GARGRQVVDERREEERLGREALDVRGIGAVHGLLRLDLGSGGEQGEEQRRRERADAAGGGGERYGAHGESSGREGGSGRECRAKCRANLRARAGADKWDGPPLAGGAPDAVDSPRMRSPIEVG